MAMRSCFDCYYCDEREVKDKKVWCSYYKSYYYPEDGYSCDRFRL